MATTVTIASGASLSDLARIPEGMALSALILPAAWTAATVTLQVGVDSAALVDLYAETAEVSLTSADASRYLNFDPIYGVRFIKVRSGTAATPVNQGADRVVELVFVPIH